MVLSDLQKGLSNFTEELSSQTYLNTYRVQKRDSLLADGLGTRANSIWKMAQYIVAIYDNKADEPLDSYLNGWKTLVKNYKNQYLIIETAEHTWRMYDSHSVYMGDDEFINDYLQKQNKVNNNNLDCNLSHQQIFYGAPGTGKSHTIEKITGNQPKENVFRTTFHPDSDYSTFVGSYKPSMKPAATKQAILDYDGLVDKFKEYLSADNNITRACTKFGFDFHDSIVKMQDDKEHTIPLLVADAYKSGTTYDTQVRAGMSVYETAYNEYNVEDKIVYSYVPQAFTKAYIRAWQTTAPVFLIIEEINRGNCAQIFGDLFQLLDRKNSVSEYPIKPDTDLGKFIYDTFVKEGCIAPQDSHIFKGNELKLPANLYIWATMNTSDQSLFPIDSAFKRRWDWRYIKIAQPKKDGTDEKFNWKIEGDIDWWQFIKKVNDIIQRMTNSADKQLGYFFAKANNENVITYDCFVSKVCFYLWNDIFKTYAVDGMENSLFKYTYMDEDDSTEKTGVLDFTKFFDEEGNVVPAIVQQFIENVMNWQSEGK